MPAATLSHVGTRMTVTLLNLLMHFLLQLLDGVSFPVLSCCAG